MYNGQLVLYKVVILVFFGIGLWKEKVALSRERKGKVCCLPLVTGFRSKLVFNLAEHPTLL